MNAYVYSIRSKWPGRADRPAAIGAKFLQTLDSLSRIDPIFDDWEVIDGRAQAAIPIGEARPRIAALVENNVYRDDFDDPDPGRGYWISGTTSKFITPRSMGFSVRAGGKHEGEAELDAGYVTVLPDPAIVTYPVFKAALLTINAIWPPAWANAYAFRRGYDTAPLIPDAPLFPSSRFHMSWIAYLSAPLAAGLDVPPEIQTERIPDGGLLMIAAEERLDPANADHVRRSRLIAEIMIERAGDPSC
jgi:hypothetical protein